MADGMYKSRPPLQHSIAPPLLFSKIPCNLCRRFPLYGVEAGGLPAKAAEQKQLNVDKDLKLCMSPSRKKQ